MKKSKVEIIQETVDYYSADPDGRRANENGDCMYLASDGRMCAVGRCMADPKVAGDYIGDYRDMLEHVRSQGVQYDILKPEYQGHSVGFWEDLQMFHDSDVNWDSNGLSELGQWSLKRLIDNWTE